MTEPTVQPPVPPPTAAVPASPPISPSPVQSSAPAPQVPHHVKPKLGRNFLTCLTYSAAILVAGLFVCLYLVAKTGLIQLPLFSRFYVGPIPTRPVTAPSMSPDAFNSLLSSKLAAQGLEKKRPPYVIRLTEKELTAGLGYGIDTILREQEWKRVTSQIVVEPDEIEMSGRFERSYVRFDVLVRFVPRVSQGGVMFDPVSIQVGDYELPSSMTQRVLGYIFSRDFSSWILKFGDLQLSAVHLSRGYLELNVASVGR